ncbi:MAG: AAA family ATPase [Gemmatimonadetes bacterium]|nr:AAA family ATPase [Gemmatimonadota bacterium]
MPHETPTTPADHVWESPFDDCITTREAATARDTKTRIDELRLDYKEALHDDMRIEENGGSSEDMVIAKEWLKELLDTEMAKAENGGKPDEAVLAFYREKIEEQSRERLISRAASFDKNAADKVLLTLEQAQVQSLDECIAPPFTGETRPVHWVIPDWLECGSVTLFAGKGGTGKSRVALQTAVQLALGGGRPVFGDIAPLFVTTKQVRTLYLSWEDDAEEYHRRLASQIKPETPPTEATAKTLDIINDCIRFVDLRERGPLWAPWAGGSKHTDTICEKTPLFDYVAEAATEHKAKLIVVDTVAAAFQGNENNRALVRQFVTALSVLSNQLDASVLLISHPSKSSDVSGSTDWENGCRAVWNLERKDDVLQLIHRKANHAPIQNDVYLAAEHYPYHAIEKPVVEQKAAHSAPKICKGYEGYTCDVEVEGRAHRCAQCKEKSDRVRWKNRGG